MHWRVPLSDLAYGLEEEEAVRDVLRRRWLTMGAVTEEFEARFASFTGARHAIAVSNATQALHLACLALGIGPGDEVLVPSLTFVASANAVLYTGADVRFIDIHNLEEPTIAPEQIEACLGPQTKAIMVVHYAGYPCRMPEIIELAKRHGLAVIEDAAHAPGARIGDRHLGLWGDVGCFSFFSNKNLATGEGGMLVTQSDKIAERLRALRSHGMTSLTWDRHQGHAHSYDVVVLGYNYRIDEIRSALGLVQLQKLPALNASRKRITEHYWATLTGSGLIFPFSGLGYASAYHIMPVVLPAKVDRNNFIEVMKGDGVQTSLHYPPVHLFSYYQMRTPGVSLPMTEAFAGREVTLPLYPDLSEEEVAYVITSVKRALTLQAPCQDE
jgi:dTDP-4-amino-4,6-dideoxygalactose transaminase